MTIALLDGDILAYRAAAALQQDIDWGDGCDEPTVNFKDVRKVVLEMAQTWVNKAECDSAIVFFTEGKCFRTSLYPRYKMNRSPLKPLAYETAKNSLKTAYPFRELPGLEADDLMGILATSPAFAQTVIVSLDKDMKTLPAAYLNPHGKKGVQRFSLGTADYNWMLQTLTGDTVDNFTGCPQVGPVKAKAILADVEKTLEHLWPCVLEAFTSRGFTEEDAICQARMARILRHEDFNSETKEIRLWHPNSEQATWLKVQATIPSENTKPSN